MRLTDAVLAALPESAIDPGAMATVYASRPPYVDPLYPPQPGDITFKWEGDEDAPIGIAVETLREMAASGVEFPAEWGLAPFAKNTAGGRVVYFRRTTPTAGGE